MLIRTIRMETVADDLFSKKNPLLPAACELAYHTVNTSPLNAEELRRDGGLETLQEAFQRCVGITPHETKSDTTACRVILAVLQCFAAAAQFPECQKKIIGMPAIVKDTVRCLWFKGRSRLAAPWVACHPRRG